MWGIWRNKKIGCGALALAMSFMKVRKMFRWIYSNSCKKFNNTYFLNSHKFLLIINLYWDLNPINFTILKCFKIYLPKKMQNPVLKFHMFLNSEENSLLFSLVVHTSIHLWHFEFFFYQLLFKNPIFHSRIKI